MTAVGDSLAKLVNSFTAVSDAAKAESEKIILERQKEELMSLPKSEEIAPPLGLQQ